jgi:uncharacterized protein YjbI with pentapeptide repeats
VRLRNHIIYSLFSLFFITYACSPKAKQDLSFSKQNQKLLFDQNFSKVNASNSQWIQSYLRRSLFVEAYLENANFKDCFAFKTDFRKAILKNANFKGCDLRYADFRGADLRDADFTDALIYDARFEGSLINKKTKIDFNEGPKGAHLIE